MSIGLDLRRLGLFLLYFHLPGELPELLIFLFLHRKYHQKTLSSLLFFDFIIGSWSCNGSENLKTWVSEMLCVFYTLHGTGCTRTSKKGGQTSLNTGAEKMDLRFHRQHLLVAFLMSLYVLK